MEKESLTREELYNMVWETPLIQLAKKYNLSDNGLRKKCKKYNILLPPVGYWSKLKYGKKIKKTPLPKIEQEYNLINLYINEEENEDKKVNVNDYSVPFMLRLRQIKKEIETCKDLPLEILKKLNNPDILIKTTKEYLNTKKKGSSNLHSDRNNILDINVSKENTSRSLLLMDYFIKLVRARGHDIKVQYGRTKVIMFTVEEDVSIREKINTIELDNYPYRKKVSTSNLIFRVKPSYHKTWHDSKSVPLEEKIVSIIAWLEAKAREVKAYWDENDRRRKKDEERKRIEQEIKERKETEIQKFNELLDEAERWHKARFVREYINYLMSNNIQNHDDFKDWIDWAKGKADWYDPLVRKVDIILGEYLDSLTD